MGMAIEFRDGVVTCLCSADVDISRFQRRLPTVGGMYQVFDIARMKVVQPKLFSYTGVVVVRSEYLGNGYEKYTAQLEGKSGFMECVPL